MKSDAELLRDYRRRGDETAFRLLVERHAGLVQGAALRRTGDVELAREAAQQVFVLLAKNAGRLYAGTGLAGWLHRTAVLVSASIKRREEKRGRIMKRYEDHVLLTGTPGAETWTEALPWVDEGLTRLPEEDRQILLAHFWQGLTYQEIATARSSSEAAVQRRASRAFVKLSRWLGKRRVAVSGGVLTAGLGTLSQPASAAGLPAAGPLASRALAGLPAAPASSVWAWRIREMLSFGKMKFAGGLLMGTFVALLAGVGFAKGRVMARQEQAQRQFAADVAEAQAALAGLTKNALPAETPPRRSLAELIAEAADHYRNDADPAGAARGEILLEQVRPDEIPEALALLEDSLGEVAIGTLMLPHLIGRWRFAVKADEAVVWVLEKIHDDEVFKSCIQPAVGAWASRDPAAAQAWWRGRTDLHPKAYGMGVYHAILIGYGQENLGFLWDELPALEQEEFDAARNLLFAGLKNPAAREEIFSRISAVPDERIRNSMFRGTGQWLARIDPSAAAAWTKDLPLTDAKEAFMVRVDVAHALMVRNPLFATQVLLQNPPGPLRDFFMEAFQKSLPTQTK